MSSTKIKPYDYAFNILLVGDSGVGKSSLLTRFVKEEFKEDEESTIGMGFSIKHVNVKVKRIKLIFWDSTGEERFRTVACSFYRGSHGIMFSYDITRRATFENLKSYWLGAVDRFNTIEDAPKIVVGNKLELECNRDVSREEGMEFAKEHGCLFLETSVKYDIAVGQAFEELAHQIMNTPSVVAKSKGCVKIDQAKSSKKSTGICY